MRSKFDEQLALMKNELIQMGALCEVYLSFNSIASSSILEVDMGSRALVGSSISRTFGSTGSFVRGSHIACRKIPE